MKRNSFAMVLASLLLIFCLVGCAHSGSTPDAQSSPAGDNNEAVEIDADRYEGAEKLVRVPDPEIAAYFAVIRDHFVLIRAYGFTGDCFENTLCGFEYTQILK